MQNFRIGTGYDIHRLVEGRSLILGGINIPHTHGLFGHSDADCLTHAIIDALLGAAGLRDIGHYFPDTDQSFKNIDSQILLKKVCEKITSLGFTISNIDTTIHAEAPKLNPHIEAMKVVIGRTLNLQPSQIGIKAGTHEKLGPIGQKEAISAQAVCLIYKSN